jgi:hypothetical protein
MADFTSFVAFLFQAAIFALLVVAVRRDNAAAAVNALGSFALAVLPAVLEVVLPSVLGWTLTFGPALPLWLGVAGFLHSLGMLGLYDTTWWWDHLTHVVSAALVAALLYAGLIVTHPGPVGSGSAPGTVMWATVAFTFAVGVFWELIELVARDVGKRLDIEPVLVHYGRRDTALDLVFDVVGALVVVGADLRVFVPLLEEVGVTETVLLGSGWVVIAGSVLMALFVGAGELGRS